MKNGVTKKLTAKQVAKLKNEIARTRVQKDLAEKYNLPIPTIYRVVEYGRCSERIYNVLFKK